jgi:hypothetical protein
MEPEGSLPHSQVAGTCPHPESAQSSPYCHIPLPEDRCIGRTKVSVQVRGFFCEYFLTNLNWVVATEASK